MATHPQHDAKQIGQRLRWLRHELRSTQVEMAALLGISLSHYSKLEIGVGRMGRQLLTDLQAKTDIDLAWFLEGRGEAWPQGRPDRNPLKTLKESGSYPGQKKCPLPDEAVVERIIEFSMAAKNLALAKKMAAQLNIPESRALAILARASLEMP